MRERLRQRLDELKAEEQAGQRLVADLERKQTELQATLLRIGGAIQVLEELLATTEPTGEPVEESVDGGPPLGTEPAESAPPGNGQVEVPV